MFLEETGYESFTKPTTENSAVKLASLFPTVDAIDELNMLLSNSIVAWEHKY